MSLTVFLTSRIPYAPMMARASDVGTTALPSCADLVPTGVIVLERSQHGWVYVAILRFSEQTHHRLRSQKGPPASSRCHRYLRLFFFFFFARRLLKTISIQPTSGPPDDLLLAQAPFELRIGILGMLFRSTHNDFWISISAARSRRVVIGSINLWVNVMSVVRFTGGYGISRLFVLNERIERGQDNGDSLELSTVPCHGRQSIEHGARLSSNNTGLFLIIVSQNYEIFWMRDILFTAFTSCS
jgi:hypothetical protein